MTNIERIRELLEEYKDCPSELDPYKVAVEIDSLYEEHNPDPAWHHQKNVLGGN